MEEEKLINFQSEEEVLDFLINYHYRELMRDPSGKTAK